jgi:hypothetical protein
MALTPRFGFRSSKMQINAPTMISKRIESDEIVNLGQLLQETREQLSLWSQNGEL